MPDPSIRMRLAQAGKVAPWVEPCRGLIALDYDGTLRSRSGLAISTDFQDLMERWRPLGLRWGINTGRSLEDLLEEILPVLRHLPDFICTAERYVYLADAATLELCPAREHNARSRDDNRASFLRHEAQMRQAYQALQAEFPDVAMRLVTEDDFSIVTENDEQMERLMPSLRALALQLDGMCYQRAGRYLRFSDARYDKGTALAYVARGWKVAPEDLVIMGDGHNDLAAFAAHPGAFHAAPALAHPEVHEFLRSTGGHVSTGGVMEALEHWAKIRPLPLA